MIKRIGFPKIENKVLGSFTVLVYAAHSDALDLKPETRPLKPCLKSNGRIATL